MAQSLLPSLEDTLESLSEAFGSSPLHASSPVASGVDYGGHGDVIEVSTEFYTEIDEEKLSQLALNAPEVLFPTEIGTSMARSLVQESTDADEEVETLHPNSVEVMMYPRSVASTVDDGESSVPSRRLSELSSPRVPASPRIPSSPRVLSSPRFGLGSPRRHQDSPRIPRSPRVLESPDVGSASGQWNASFAMEHDFVELSPFTVEDVIEPFFEVGSENLEDTNNNLKDDPSNMKFEELRIMESAKELHHTLDQRHESSHGTVDSEISSHGVEDSQIMSPALGAVDSEISASPFIKAEAQDGPLGITIDSILERYGEFDLQASILLQKSSSDITELQRAALLDHHKDRTAWEIEKKLLLSQLQEAKTDLQELQTEHRMLQWVRDTLQYELYTLQDELSQAHSLQDELAQANTRNSQIVRQGVLTIQNQEHSLLTTQRKAAQRKAVLSRMSSHHDKINIISCFGSWLCLLCIARDRVRMSMHVLKRLQRRVASEWMGEWCAVAMQAKRERHIVIKVLLRWSTQQLSVMMRAWVLYFLATKKMGTAELRASKARVSLLLSSHFSSWHEFTRAKVQIAWKAVNLFNKIGRRLREETFVLWYEEACCGSLSSHALNQTVGKIQRLRLSSSLLRWQCAWRDRNRLMTIGKRVREAGLIPLSLDPRIRITNFYTPTVARPLAAWKTKWGVGPDQEGLRTAVAGWRLVTHNSGRMSTAVSRIRFLREGTCLVSGFYHWAGLVGDFVRVTEAARTIYASKVQATLTAVLSSWIEQCPGGRLDRRRQAEASSYLQIEGGVEGGAVRKGVSLNSTASSAEIALAERQRERERAARTPSTSPGKLSLQIPTRGTVYSPSPSEEVGQAASPRPSLSPAFAPARAQSETSTVDGAIDALVSWASDREGTQRGRTLSGVMRRRLRACYAQWHGIWAEKSMLTRSVSRLSTKHLRQRLLRSFITWRNFTPGLGT